jgi:PGF-pre-PGF domain-containing protein
MVMGLSIKERLLEHRKNAPLKRTTVATGIAVVLLLSLFSSLLPATIADSIDSLQSDGGMLQFDDGMSSLDTPSQIAQEPAEQDSSSDSGSSGIDPAPDDPADDERADPSDEDSVSDLQEDDSSSSPPPSDSTGSDGSYDETGSIGLDDLPSTDDMSTPLAKPDKFGETDDTSMTIFTFEPIPSKGYDSQSGLDEHASQLPDSDAGDETVTYIGTIGTIMENNRISVRTSTQNQTRMTISQVDFTAAENNTNVSLSVKYLKEKPDEIVNELLVDTASSIYQYVDIKLTANDEYIGESGVRSMTFTFEINMSWIEDHHIDKTRISMMRYHNDTWQVLNTTLINETTLYITFQAETPGLSIFAVVGDQIIEDSDEIVKDSIQFPWWTPLSLIMFSTFALGIVLVKKRYIYVK